MFENAFVHGSDTLGRSPTNEFVRGDLFTCERGGMWNVREEGMQEVCGKTKGMSFFPHAGLVCEVIFVCSLNLNARKALWSARQEVRDTFVV